MGQVKRATLVAETISYNLFLIFSNEPFTGRNGEDAAHFVLTDGLLVGMARPLRNK